MCISRSMCPMLAATVWLVLSAVLTAPATGDEVLGSSSAQVHLPTHVGGLYASPGFTADSVNGPSWFPFGDVYFSGGAPADTSAGPAGTEFLGAASLLTNGADNSLGVLYAGQWYDLKNESVSLSGSYFASPDFQGSTVTSMNLVQTDWYSYPAPDYTYIAYTITYYGTPEPATLSLLALGGLALLRRRMRQ